MAGHSKWATTKRHKAVIDAKRGKIFSVISKEMTLAARAGGGDPNFNPRLRMLIQRAKDANMPADNVDRAIKKGTGELPGVEYFELVYEGYAPGGVGIIVEVTTDNKNRSASEVRSMFTKCGGNLAGAGALAFNFRRKGQFLIGADKVAEDKLMEIAIEAGAEDILNEGDHFEVITEIGDFDAVSSALEKEGIQPESSELAYLPNTPVEVSDPDVVKQVLRLVGLLEDLEDVKAVWANYDIADELMDG